MSDATILMAGRPQAERLRKKDMDRRERCLRRGIFIGVQTSIRLVLDRYQTEHLNVW